MIMECIFCKIAHGELQADKVYEDELVVGFRDLQPQAPTHVLVIPKKHIATMNDVSHSDMELLSSLLNACRKIAEGENLSERGYRIVINCNKDAGQVVFHLHVHLLGGREMGWPPG